MNGEEQGRDDGAGVSLDGREGAGEEAREGRAQENRRARRKRPMGGAVYFIETEDAQFVKIGFSTNVNARLAVLKTIMPLNLLGCLPGTPETEVWLHEKFSHCRHVGEWFHSCDELRGFIEAVGLITPPEPGSEVMTPKEPDSPRAPNPAAVAVAQALVAMRNKKLTAEQRSAIASGAAKARWAHKKGNGGGK